MIQILYCNPNNQSVIRNVLFATDNFHVANKRQWPSTGLHVFSLKLIIITMKIHSMVSNSVMISVKTDITIRYKYIQKRCSDYVARAIQNTPIVRNTNPVRFGCY